MTIYRSLNQDQPQRTKAEIEEGTPVDDTSSPVTEELSPDYDHHLHHETGLEKEDHYEPIMPDKDRH